MGWLVAKKRDSVLKSIVESKNLRVQLERETTWMTNVNGVWGDNFIQKFTKYGFKSIVESEAKDSWTGKWAFFVLLHMIGKPRQEPEETVRYLSFPTYIHEVFIV